MAAAGRIRDRAGSRHALAWLSAFLLVGPAGSSNAAVPGDTRHPGPETSVDVRARLVPPGFRGHRFDDLIRYVKHESRARTWAIELPRDSTATLTFDPDEHRLRVRVETQAIRSSIEVDDPHAMIRLGCREARPSRAVGHNRFGARTTVERTRRTCDVLRLVNGADQGDPGVPAPAAFSCSASVDPRQMNRVRVFAVVEYRPDPSDAATFLTESGHSPTWSRPVDDLEMDRHLTVRLVELWVVDSGSGRILGRGLTE